MLTLDPKERITIKDALNHPWIVKNMPVKSEKSKELDSDIANKLKKGKRRSSL